MAETSAPDLLAALKALLPEVDAEIEQRQSSGNDEYWLGLKALSDAAHAAIAKAGSDLDLARSDAAYYAKVLLKLRATLLLVQDNIEDEVDRSYFGSTNDADQLREVAQDIDAIAWDRIMASSQPPVDLYAIIACHRDRYEQAEASVAGAVEALRQQKAWVNHWLDDLAHGLKPTEGSLRDALAEIDAAMLKAGAYGIEHNGFPEANHG